MGYIFFTLSWMYNTFHKKKKRREKGGKTVKMILETEILFSIKLMRLIFFYRKLILLFDAAKNNLVVSLGDFAGRYQFNLHTKSLLWLIFIIWFKVVLKKL